MTDLGDDVGPIALPRLALSLLGRQVLVGERKKRTTLGGLRAEALTGDYDSSPPTSRPIRLAQRTVIIAIWH